MYHFEKQLKLIAKARKQAEKVSVSPADINPEAFNKLTEGLAELILSSDQMKTLEEKIAKKMEALNTPARRAEKRRAEHESFLMNIGITAEGNHTTH